MLVPFSLQLETQYSKCWQVLLEHCAFEFFSVLAHMPCFIGSFLDPLPRFLCLKYNKLPIIKTTTATKINKDNFLFLPGLCPQAYSVVRQRHRHERRAGFHTTARFGMPVNVHSYLMSCSDGFTSDMCYFPLVLVIFICSIYSTQCFVLVCFYFLEKRILNVINKPPLSIAQWQGRTVENSDLEG